MAKAAKSKAKGKNHLSLVFWGIIIALACTSGSWLFSFVPFMQKVELLSLDFRFQTRKPVECIPHLGYVNMDNESCDLAGEWPWKRKYHVAMVKTLAFYGARAAGYDVFFAENSGINNEITSVNFEALDETTAGQLPEMIFRDYDEEFRQALVESDIIYLGEYLVGPEQVNVENTPEGIRKHIKEKIKISAEKALAIKAAQKDAFSANINPVWENHVTKTVDITAPIEKLSLASKGVGFEQIIPDDITGTVYEYPMFLEYDGHIYPALGLLMVADVLGIDLSQIHCEPGKYFEFETTKAFGEYGPGKFRVPINEKLRLLMNWSAPYFDTFFHINYKQLSYFYAWTESKRILRGIDVNLENAAEVKAYLENIIINKNWVPGEMAGEIAQELTLASIAMKTQESELEVAAQALKDIFEAELDQVKKVFSGVFLSKKVLKNATEADVSEALAQMHTHDYLEFRQDLYDQAQYGAVDAKHQKEIARNILAFKARDEIEEVSPLYFPPCQHTHADGKVVDLSPTMLKDKIFMIGLEGEGTIDLNPQPYQEACAMVALHANAINTFLTRQFLSFPDKNKPLFITLILTILVAVVTQLSPNRISAPFFLLVLGGFIYYSYDQFSSHGKTLITVYPLVGIVSAYLITVGLQLYFEFLEKQKVKGMFGKMVSPDVLKVMSDDPDMFSLTGKRMPCTSYFSSMENFPAISKGVTPQELTGLLSNYLTPASQIVTSYSGYIDKYEGHIIMADFGVPIKNSEHQLQCLYSSIEQQLDIVAFRHYAKARFGKDVNTSMGVNAGFVSAGNMGSDRKMQYTIMGDTVNTAARFRPANWIYDQLGSIIIGEMTYPVVQDIIESRLLDKLLLKGKLKPVNIYQVLGWDPETYMKTRGQQDVTETIRMCWAKHCPPEKIYGYHLHWQKQFERRSHPLCEKLSHFFESKINYAAELTEIDMKNQILGNYLNYKEVEQHFAEITGKNLPDIPVGPWEEVLAKWFEELEFELNMLDENFKGNLEAEKLHRDLTEVHEKVDALNDRLKWNEPIHPLLDQAWENIRAYISSDFHGDEEEYDEKYEEVYARYESDANKLVDEVSVKMDEYHEMMSLVGSRTDDEIKGCEIYEQALELQWQRKWDESIAKFNEVLTYLPKDKAALSFIRRLQAYKEAPPADDWQGEFKQTKK
ncbi:MAG: CHASE2 domain-containing protein [Planctomycetes bacterium]|nr:CHASE2 domain-containing protein [Planctomycetota bacterium]